MRRILTVLMVCASCGGAEGPARPAAGAGEATSARLQSCYVVKDDLGAVGFFAAFEPGTSRIPGRLDSITFFGEDDTTPVLTWNKGVELKPLDAAAMRRARRGPTRPTKPAPTKPTEPRLRYATNVQAVDWGDDTGRWPLTATVTMEGAVQPSCVLAELAADNQSRPSALGSPNNLGIEAFGYGNCPHCLARFLCGCLELEEELEYCEPPPDLEPLDNCPDVLDYLFTAPP